MNNVRDATAVALDALQPEFHVGIAHLLSEIAAHPLPGLAIKAAREAVASTRPPHDDEIFED